MIVQTELVFPLPGTRRPAGTDVPRLRDPVSPEAYAEACAALEIDPLHALRNPVAALPRVAMCSPEQGNRFLRAVLHGPVPDLYDLDSFDTAALYLSNVFVHLMGRVKRQAHARRSTAGIDILSVTAQAHR